MHLESERFGKRPSGSKYTMRNCSARVASLCKRCNTQRMQRESEIEGEW